MKSLAIGSFLAALAMFVWGWMFWDTPASGEVFSDLGADQAADLGAALNAALPADGTYVLPDPAGGDQETFARQMATGPLAVVYYRRAGAQAMDPVVMLKGFLHTLLTAAIFGFILHGLRDKVVAYSDKVKLIATIGLGATIWANLADAIWFHQSWSHHLWISFYNLVAYLLAGLVLARFIKTSKS